MRSGICACDRTDLGGTGLVSKAKMRNPNAIMASDQPTARMWRSMGKVIIISWFSILTHDNQLDSEAILRIPQENSNSSNNVDVHAMGELIQCW